MEQKIWYSIGEASLVCGIPIKTLRYYDDIKLIVPENRNEKSNYRYYSKSQVITLLTVRRLRLMGCSIKTIKEVVEKDDLCTLKKQVEIRNAEILSEIDQLHAMHESGADFLHRLEQALTLCQAESKDAFGTGLLHGVKIEQIPEVNLFFEQKLMPNYRNADVSLDRWTQINERCYKKGLEVIGPVIVTYHTNLLDQFLMKDCEVEFGIQVKENPGCSQIRQFGGFLGAVAVHIGDYATIMNTHVMMLQWINQNGYEVVGKVSEEFIIAPIEVHNKDAHITKIIIPVQKIADRI